jgi:YVTN family beta-propeller protein
MKKSISTLLVVVSLLLFAGCGGGSSNQTTLTSADKETPKQEVKKISLVNQAPVATFSNFTINRDSRYDGQLTASDADGDTLKYIIVTKPKHGSVELHDNGCFIYKPDSGYKGEDSFSYKASDDLSSCAVKTVVVTVCKPVIKRPNAPTELKLKALSTTKLKLTWIDNSDNEEGFVLYRDATPVANIKANETSIELDGQKPDHDYYFVLKAKNAGGLSDPASVTGRTKDVTSAPKAPTELKVYAKDKTSVRLKWKDNSDNESAFEVYQDGVKVKTVSNSCSCVVITGLKECSSYEFEVKAVNKIGDASSNLLDIETMCDEKLPKVYAFFGDKENNKVIVVDVRNMELIAQKDTNHLITYTPDKVAGKPKVYVVNRGSDFIDVMDTNTLEIINTIPLKHHPRSAETMNKTLGLCEVSGMDKPMASIIDINTDKVVAVVGKDIPVDMSNNQNHGGGHATGHPFWLDTNHFALLDRYNRKIVTYFIDNNGTNWNVKKINELNTTTSAHQIIPGKGNYKGEKNTFYATLEGSDESYPSVLELKLTSSGLEKSREISLIDENVSILDMSVHHGDFHPNEKSIYVGSANGTMFVVDYETMTIKTTIKVGKGAGHTVFSKERNYAFVINHSDVFVTVVNSLTNEKIKDVVVSKSTDLVGNSTIQAHPKYYLSSDGKYFYAFVTSDGTMYEMDLETLEVTRTVDVGGKPAQGSFVKYF